jgi:hypothetical protein
MPQAMSVRFPGQVHRRVDREEVIRLQHKARVFHRHDGKVLRLANVAVVETMPHHDILCSRSIGSVGHTRASRRVAGHPQVLAGEAPATLFHPQMNGCPILRAFCEGWDTPTLASNSALSNKPTVKQKPRRLTLSQTPRKASWDSCNSHLKPCAGHRTPSNFVRKAADDPIVASTQRRQVHDQQIQRIPQPDHAQHWPPPSCSTTAGPGRCGERRR